MSKFPFLGILGVAFVALKLMGKLDWSWWLITLPLWLLPAAILLLFAVLVVVGALYDIARRSSHL